VSEASPRRLGPGVVAVVPAVASLAAVGLALVVGGLVLAATGTDALAAVRLLVGRGLGSADGLNGVLVRAAPLLIVAAGLLVALRAGVWNIGVDGQVLVGALATGIAAPAVIGAAPAPVLWLVGGFAGAAGGLAWAALPALLRARWGLNEIFTTLMMNYVAFNLVSYAVKGPAKDPAAVPPQTRSIPPELRLPDLPGTEIHLGLLVGLAGVVVVAALFRGTVLGFALDVLGRSPRAARHAGLPVARLTALALLLSGAFAGLAGAGEVLGVRGLVQGSWTPGYGVAAFAVAYLARLRPVWLVPFAGLLAWIALGGELMVRPLGIPTGFVELLEGLMLASFALVVVVERRFLAGRRTVDPLPDRAEEESTDPLPAELRGAR